MKSNYLKSIIKTFAYYRSLGQKAIDQTSDNHLFQTVGPASNSIAVIVKHLHGNMMSRWTHFLEEDGEKEWRDRDGEFESTILDRAELQKKYDEGWDCLLETVRKLEPHQLTETVYIRNQGHTVVEAINRQMGHIPYHIGQIVYLSKMYSVEEWKSLSIPKGESKTFNKSHFEKPKRIEHFTDEFMDKEGGD